jgi:hypothetical protein
VIMMIGPQVGTDFVMNATAAGWHSEHAKLNLRVYAVAAFGQNLCRRCAAA